MIKGSCSCGKLQYEADCEPMPYVHCHCETCRKTHGSAFSSVMGVPKSLFKWVAGKENIRSFESSKDKFRKFCNNCGSHIIAERKNSEIILLRMGCLDTPFEHEAVKHIWRSDGAEWYNPKVVIDEMDEGLI